ncbi:hypothetical protein EVAR_2877_1 [Eumeta japonica]|uniref:Uncharacterized protein n=1 Tax=Eumeta variegata TaxID=151549 RepID=A0A4C1T1I1_EUMVA|nr:hypothetical protein EVAR_2877_1 [Eumeta japonica]
MYLQLYSPYRHVCPLANGNESTGRDVQFVLDGSASAHRGCLAMYGEAWRGCNSIQYSVEMSTLRSCDFAHPKASKPIRAPRRWHYGSLNAGASIRTTLSSNSPAEIDLRHFSVCVVMVLGRRGY